MLRPIVALAMQVDAFLAFVTFKLFNVDRGSARQRALDHDRGRHMASDKDQDNRTDATLGAEPQDAAVRPGQSPGHDIAIMTSVLEAEERARERIDDAWREGAHQLEVARDSARRISGRADERVQALHRKSNARVDARKAELVAHFEATRDSLREPVPDAVLDTAARRVAHRLIGADRE